MNILKQAEGYKPYNSQEEKDGEVSLKYLNTFDNYLSRENEYGHMTTYSPYYASLIRSFF